MKAIVCADQNNCIGKDNQLLVHISEDLKRFRKLTDHHEVVMGRKTYESLPTSLPNRICHILSHTKTNNDCSHHFFHSSVERLMQSITDPDNTFVIGGGQVYELLLPYCDTVYMTRVFEDFIGDTYFPRLLDHPDWDREDGQIVFDGKYQYRFETYTRRLKSSGC